MTEQDTDELYQVSLADFVRVRDAIAARRKAAGDADGAAEVKRARKPSLPAWAANQVVWHAPEVWQRLQAAADALRRAHEKGAPADELRQAGREQREALAACQSRSAGFLVANGHAATPTVVQKAAGTLHALAYGTAGAEPGRVKEELPPPGFEALAGMSLASPAPAGRGTPPVVPETPAPSTGSATDPRAEREARQREQEGARRRAARAEAEERLGRARTAFAAARRAVDAAKRALDGAEADAAAAQADVAVAEADLSALPGEDG